MEARKKAAQKKAPTSITFIYRRFAYKTKMPGCVLSLVRSIKTVKGEQEINDYQVMRYADGRMSCNCSARKECKHIVHVQCEEMRRCDDVKPVHVCKVAKQVAPAVVVVESQRMVEYRKSCAEWEARNEAAAQRINERNRKQLPWGSDEEKATPVVEEVQTANEARMNWLLGSRQNGMFSDTSRKKAS